MSGPGVDEEIPSSDLELEVDVLGSHDAAILCMEMDGDRLATAGVDDSGAVVVIFSFVLLLQLSQL